MKMAGAKNYERSCFSDLTQNGLLIESSGITKKYQPKLLGFYNYEGSVNGLPSFLKTDNPHYLIFTGKWAVSNFTKWAVSNFETDLYHKSFLNFQIQIDEFSSILN